LLGVDAALSAILTREKIDPLETTSKSLIKFARRKADLTDRAASGTDPMCGSSSI
jgi:hypothetical protein